MHESTAPGVIVQALIVNTLLEPSVIKVVDWAYWSILAVPLLAALMALLWWRRLTIGLGGVIILGLVCVVLGNAAFVWRLWLVPIAPILIPLPAVTVVALVVRSRLPRRP